MTRTTTGTGSLERPAFGGLWAIAQVYTLALILLAILVAHRHGDRRDQAVKRMALRGLAALRSPFVPGYVTIGLLCATILLAVEVRSARGGFGLVFRWLLILVVPPGLRPATCPSRAWCKRSRSSAAPCG